MPNPTPQSIQPSPPTQPLTLPTTLIILGPTAVGKSALALEIAKRFPAEIISLDAMQIYRGMDIGTAKPSPAERQRVPHHLIDCQPVDLCSNAAQFLARVAAAQHDIAMRRRLCLCVGGTAMYIKLLVDGLCDAPPAAPELRRELYALAAQHGSAWLHEHLLKPCDPLSAARIHPSDLRRIVRAIEVFRLCGQPFSSLQTQWSTPPQHPAPPMIGLTMDRSHLYQRINARVDEMIAAGLLDEVRRLRSAGIERNPSASHAIGYKELLAHLRGEYSLDLAITLIKRNTRRFAKHQLTWFRKDHRIIWFDVEQYATTAALADAVLARVPITSP
ncbi:MAG: tRNA (adenosine(37)-N6)-dimethylallyltransferase MiaA [bacterium]|nr:tRNA (adenosine(37)-N6)-dimethylallyltransferase MiaA [bacterium]